MTGISQTITVRDVEVRERLALMVERMENPRGFYANVGEIMLNSSHDNFEREAGPDGIPWQRLMPKTIERRERKGLTPIAILRARGRFAGSINTDPSATGVRIGSPSPQAAIHQLGGKIKMPERQQTIYQHYNAKTDTLDQKFRRKSRSNFARDVTVKAHVIDMPARPYLGVSPTNEVDILKAAAQWLGEE